MPTPPARPDRARRPALPRGARLALALVGVPALVLVLGWAWQAVALARIPDVGEPFDVAAFARNFPRDVPPDRNAYTYYVAAVGAQRPSKYRVYQDLGSSDVKEWSAAGPELRARVAENRAAIDLWRLGAECDAALYHRLDGLTPLTLMPATQELRTFARLALLEGSRLEGEGDLAGAWGIYRALLRSSRHAGRDGLHYERVVGAQLLRLQAAPRVRRWAADPRVDAELLRRALADARAAEAMTPPGVEPLKLEYFVTLRALDDPSLLAEYVRLGSPGGPPPSTGVGRLLADYDPMRWLRMRRAISRFERERTRRVLNLLWANRLAQLARPPGRRAPVAVADLVIYAADPAAPPAANAVAPDTLARWYRTSPLHTGGPDDWVVRWTRDVDRERAEWDALVVALAGELYRRDRGAPPPSPAALVPEYLDRLPDDFTPAAAEP